jgi:hypothetical protein
MASSEPAIPVIWCLIRVFYSCLSVEAPDDETEKLQTAKQLRSALAIILEN